MIFSISFLESFAGLKSTRTFLFQQLFLSGGYGNDNNSRCSDKVCRSFSLNFIALSKDQIVFVLNICNIFQRKTIMNKYKKKEGITIALVSSMLDINLS